MKYYVTMICKVVFAGMLAGSFFASCSEDEWSRNGNDGWKGIALSSYKEKVLSRTMEEGDRNFDEGIKYRIWVTEAGNTSPELPGEENGIEATEALLDDKVHYIDLKRSIEGSGKRDFYGFTQNSTEVCPEPKLVNGFYPITLQEDGDYTDYLRGKLLYPYGEDDYAQGNILQIPFRHIMSQVTFQVSKAKEVDSRITLKKIEMIGSKDAGIKGITSEGTYNVYDNSFVFEEENEVREIDGGSMEVPSADIESPESAKGVKTILVFPTFETVSDNESKNVPLTYLRVTFDDENGFYGKEGERSVEIPIYNTLTTANLPLEFKQNFRYTLHIAFSSDVRRVVTLVPQVYEWLEGETETGNVDGKGYEQDMGQPVTFNGILWSDRNLGATSGNPARSVDDWLRSVGYVYQYGRNIPYFPYKAEDLASGKIDYNTPLKEALQNKRQVYPVVDLSEWGTNPNVKVTSPEDLKGSLIWDLEEAQKKRNNANLGYYIADYKFDLLEGYDNDWAESKKTPCPPGWRLPTTRDFMGIMPSSGYSGNITFRIFQGYADAGTGGWKATQKTEYDYETNEKNREALKNQIDFREGTTKGDKVYEGEYPYLFRKEADDFLDGSNVVGQYILSMGGDDEGLSGAALDKIDKRAVRDLTNDLKREEQDGGKDYTYHWGTIYGIKNQGRSDAYRVKWSIKLVTEETPEIKWEDNRKEHVWIYQNTSPFRGLLEISRYETSSSDSFEKGSDDKTYGDVLKRYDWEHPVEVMYLPIGGFCDASGSSGTLMNIGTEVWYATSELSDKQTNEGFSMKKMIWIKYAGQESQNSQTIQYTDRSRLNAAVFVRCVRDLYNTGNN